MENILKNMLIAFSEANNTLSLVRNNSTLAEGTITYGSLDEFTRELGRDKSLRLQRLLLNLGILDYLVEKYGNNYTGTQEKVLLDCIFDNYKSFESTLLKYLNIIPNNHEYIETTRFQDVLVISENIPKDKKSSIDFDITLLNKGEFSGITFNKDDDWVVKIYPNSIFHVTINYKEILFQWNGYELIELACIEYDTDFYNVNVKSDNPVYSSISTMSEWKDLIKLFTKHDYSTSKISDILKDAAEFRKSVNGLYTATFLTGGLDFTGSKLCFVSVEGMNNKNEGSVEITGFYPDIMPNVESDSERYLSIEGIAITDQIAADIIKIFNSFNGVLPTKEVLLEKLKILGLTKEYLFEKD